MKKYYIVRTEKAGVFFGEIVERKGNEIKMKNARGIWYWNGACGLAQLATDGTTKPDNCKFTVVVDEIELLGVTEIIPCTQKAEASLKAVKVWSV